MSKLKTLFVAWARNRRAVTAMEYGLIASAMAFILIAAFASLSTPISVILTKIGNSI